MIRWNICLASICTTCRISKTFIMDIKNENDNYKEQRAQVRAKTHNVCDNYCQRVLDYFNITK